MADRKVGIGGLVPYYIHNSMINFKRGDDVHINRTEDLFINDVERQHSNNIIIGLAECSICVTLILKNVSYFDFIRWNSVF